MKDYIPPRIWPQCLLTLLCNLGTISLGLHIGWTSPLQPKLMSLDSPLGEDAAQLTIDEISWVGSMHALALLMCAPIFGFFVQLTGRKAVTALSTTLHFVSFLILVLSRNVAMIYAGRFIGGFASAGSLVITPIYITETSKSSLRGLLCGSSGFFITFGLLLAYVMGAYTSYVTFCLFCMSFSMLFFLFYPWIPESPVYLMMTDKQEEAIKAMFKLQGGSRESIEREIQQISESNHPKTPDEGWLKTFRSFVSDKAFQKALCIIIVVTTVQQLSGAPAIIVYNVYLFEGLNIAISPFLASIIIAVCQLVSSVLGAFLVDRAGRKFLLVTFASFTGVALAVLTGVVAFRFQSDDSILAILLVIVIISSFSIGFGSVPFVLFPELFRPEMRGVAGTVSNTFASILIFVTLKIFPVVTETAGLEGSLGFFAATTLSGVVIMYFVLFETRGKSLEEILQILRNEQGQKQTQIL